VLFAWLFSGRKTDVMDVGHRKENAINTAQFVHVFTGKGSTVLIVIFFPVKDSGSWTHDTEKTIA
jgi:hypothetical protein